MGILDGVRVVDLTWGISGPLSTTLLADHGAAVTRIEPPSGAPFAVPDGVHVWGRGARSAILDLKSPAGRSTLENLLRAADVLVDSFSPATAARLGLDPTSVASSHPHLIHCSITAYGQDGPDAERPGYDLLVSARAGAEWTDNDEQGCGGLGPRRPVVSASSMCSIATGYLATLGIASALFSRERTGRGQHVATSLMQGILHLYGYRWLRPTVEGSLTYQGGLLGEANNWGIYEAADGWLCNWPGTPEWAIAAARGEQLRRPEPEEFIAHRSGKPRVLTTADRLEIISAARAAFRKFSVDDWVALGAQMSIGIQPVRSPGQAFSDPALINEGVVVESTDADGTPVRTAGIVYRFSQRPTQPSPQVPVRGAHTAEVEREGSNAPSATAHPQGDGTVPGPGGPLAGVRVLDLGLAVAGPWATQLLADLGADVIKIDPVGQAAWIAGSMGAAVNAGKRSLGLDLKHPLGSDTLRRLIQSADVVTMNMRPQAAVRLGLDEASVRALNERIIYCHSRGFEDGPRSQLPGTDQTCNALGGGMYEAGGMADGGRPYFGAASGGDLGNGYLSAIAIVKALYDREKTGVAQAVDTSILNAVIMNNSRVVVRQDGSELPRHALNASMHRMRATYGVYECSDGWLALAAVADSHWGALLEATFLSDQLGQFADHAAREAHDTQIAHALSEVFASSTVDEALQRLGAAGVPCERYEADSPSCVLDSEENLRRGWVLDRVGSSRTGPVRMFGVGIDFSLTPSVISAGPPLHGQHSVEVLLDSGFSREEVDRLVAEGAVTATSG